MTIELYDAKQLEATHTNVMVGDFLTVFGKWTNSGYIPPDIGVVFMSGYAGDSLDGVDLDAEDVMFLQKPASPEAFADALTKVCRNAQRD